MAASKSHARRSAPRMSKLGREATALFDEAVQKELALLARKKIPTLVIVNGERVTAVPRKVGGRFVVRPPDEE